MGTGLLFWHFAWLAMATILSCGLLGWRAIRAGEVARHRAWMQRAILAVGVFVLAYVLKVILLGKEDLSGWSRAEIVLLRLHETFVAVMLLAGAGARALARRAEQARGSRLAQRHRWLGRTALVMAALALASGSWVLLVLRRLEAP